MVFLLVSLIQMSVTMWYYHTLAEAVSYATRVAASRGAGCAGKTCATTIGSMAQVVASRAIGLPSSAINVTFSSSAAGTTAVTCNPLSSCLTNATAWPSVAANTAGTDLTIRASYAATLPMAMFAPKWGAQRFNNGTLAAQSRQMVVY